MTKIKWRREKTDGVSGTIEYHLYLDDRNAGYLSKSDDQSDPVYLFKNNKKLDGILCGNTLAEAKANVEDDLGWLKQNNLLNFSIKKGVDDLAIKKIKPQKVGRYLMVTLDEAQSLLKLAGYKDDKSSLDRLIGDSWLLLAEQGQNEKSYFRFMPFTPIMISRKGLTWLAYKHGEPTDSFTEAVDMVFSKAKRA